MLVPLYGFVEGDTLGVLVLAHDDDTVARVIERLRRAVAVRVALDGELELVHQGRALAPALTVAEAGVEPLGRIDLRRCEEAP